MSFWVPTVIEQTHRGEREWGIFSRLLKDRIILSAAAACHTIGIARTTAMTVSTGNTGFGRDTVSTVSKGTAPTKG